jgi:hypothetical protein
MSNIRVNKIQTDSEAAVLFTKGLTIPETHNITADITNVTGVVTASNFSGSASGLTNLSGISVGRGIAISFIV